jgi:hypothetical protein
MAERKLRERKRQERFKWLEEKGEKNWQEEKAREIRRFDKHHLASHCGMSPKPLDKLGDNSIHQLSEMEDPL